MARVYLAVQRGPVAHKLVVVKRLRQELANEPAFVDMFVDESRVAVRMNHQNVIHTYEASAESGEYFIAMEFLEGQTLSQLLHSVSRERMPLGLHLWILCEVLSGLRYAHELRDFDGTPLEIVHRDVSPSNVFVTRMGEVKLMDFGIAKLSGSVAETQHGTIKGKIGYAAPEQCLGRPADARSDVYSVGIMLWEAIAGRRRACGDTALASVQARVLDLEPDISVVCPDVAPELAQIVRNALAFDPMLRFATVAAFHAELHDYCVRIGGGQGGPALGALVVEHFAEEMSQLRRLIEGQLGSLSPLQARSVAPVSGTSGLTATGSLPPVQSTVASPSRRRVLAGRLRPWLGYGLGATLLGLLALAVLQHGASEASVGAPSPLNHEASATVAKRGESTPVGEPSALARKDAEVPSFVPSSSRQPEPSQRVRTSPPPVMHNSAAYQYRARPRAVGTLDSATSLEPGVDLRGQRPPPPPPARDLDEKNPY
jgi:serine/threonine-protein kinase